MVQNKAQLSIYIVGAMLVADFVLFGYWPSRQRLEVLCQAQAKQGSLVSLAKVHQQQLAALRDSLTRCDRTLAQFQNRVPMQRELGSFLQDVSVLMDRNQLVDHVIMPGVETSTPGLTAVPVTVLCKGDLKDLYAFYRQFTSIERLVHFEKVQFVDVPDRPGRVQMDARMVLFYRPGTSRGDESALAECDL